MEQNTAILIADLSGYSALTDAHGASTAAGIIDTYLAIVGESLSGSATLHERIGDEVMIVSESADDLINTAVRLVDNASKETHFLQIHGGLHYGKILKYNNHYFGSPVNHASRIASQAKKGTFWVSSAFIKKLLNPGNYLFSPKGKFQFKNINEMIEVHELVVNNQPAYYVDPICRMLVNQEQAIQHPREKEIFFCSTDCLHASLQNADSKLMLV